MNSVTVQQNEVQVNPVHQLLTFLKQYGNTTSDELLTLLIEKDLTLANILPFIAEHTKTEHLLEFILQHGSLIVLQGDTQLFNNVIQKYQNSLTQQNQTIVQKIVSESCSAQIDIVKRTTEKYSPQAVLYKLLDEGIDPSGSKKGNWKINAINVAAQKLDIVQLTGFRAWKPTVYGESIGCSQYSVAAVYYSQTAYELIKQHFLNR